MIIKVIKFLTEGIDRWQQVKHRSVGWTSPVSTNMLVELFANPNVMTHAVFLIIILKAQVT